MTDLDTKPLSDPESADCNKRILEAYEQMLSRSHNSSIIALDQERARFLAFHLVDREHLESFLKRNNVPPPQAREIARKLTEKPSNE